MKTVNCNECIHFESGFFQDYAKCKKGKRLYFINPKPDFSNEFKWGYRRRCELFKLK